MASIALKVAASSNRHHGDLLPMTRKLLCRRIAGEANQSQCRSCGTTSSLFLQFAANGKLQLILAPLQKLLLHRQFLPVLVLLFQHASMVPESARVFSFLCPRMRLLRYAAQLFFESPRNTKSQRKTWGCRLQFA